MLDVQEMAFQVEIIYFEIIRVVNNISIVSFNRSLLLVARPVLWVHFEPVILVGVPIKQDDEFLVIRYTYKNFDGHPIRVVPDILSRVWVFQYVLLGRLHELWYVTEPSRGEWCFLTLVKMVDIQDQTIGVLMTKLIDWDHVELSTATIHRPVYDIYCEEVTILKLPMSL